MQVSIALEELRSLLTQVMPVIPRRSGIPITENALLQAADGRLSATATNLETVIIAQARATVQKEGRICVPGRLLADLVGSLRDGDGVVTMRSVCPASKDEPPSLDIERGRSRSHIAGTRADEFPPDPPVNGQSSLALDTRELARVVDSVIHAAGKDESRPVLTGTLLEYKPGQLRLVAADGFRLAIAKSTITSDNGADIAAVVPSGTMRIVADAVRNRSGTVEFVLAPDQSRAQFKIHNLTVITQLLQGEFPKYRLLVPDSHRAQVVVNRDEMRRAVRRCGVFARPGQNIIRLESHGDALLHLSIRSEKLGSALAAIVPAKMTGHTQIAFNYLYLRDLANAPGSDFIAIETNDPSDPAVFRDEDGRKLEVVMPMRLQ